MAKKGSLKSDEAMQSGFGIQEGKVEVVDSRFKIIQRVKRDGTTVTPMLVWQLDCTKDGDQEVSTKDLIVCWGSKEVESDGLHRFAFHPGKADSGTDEDPEDLGAELDTEGNTFVSTGEATSLFADSDAALFSKSLEMRGFKPEVNKQCFAPNYVGMVMEIKTVTKAEFAKTVKVRYTPREGASDTVWEVVKIHKFPGEKGSGKKAEKAKALPAANGKAGDDAGELAAETVKKVAESKDFKGKEGIARSKFQAAVLTQLHRDKKVKEQAAVMKLVKDDEWIVALGGELGFIVDVDEGQLSFIAE